MLDRRAFLVLAASTAGCASANPIGQNQTTPETTPTETETIQSGRNQQRQRKVAEQPIGSTVSFGGLKVTVNDLQLANKLQFQDGGTREPEDGRLFALVHITATNTASEPVRFPLSSEISLLIGESQYGATTFVTLQSDTQNLAEPVTGTFYSPPAKGHPEVTARGWLAFEIPKARSATVAWAGPDTQAYWNGNLNPNELPDIELVKLTAPDSVTHFSSIPITVHVENTGGSPGRFEATLDSTLPVEPHEISQEIPPNSNQQITVEIPYQSSTISTPEEATFSIADESVTVHFSPIQLAYGDQWTDPNNVDVTISELRIRGRLTRETEYTNQTYTPDNDQFTLAKIAVTNNSTESLFILGPRNYDAIVDGERYNDGGVGGVASALPLIDGFSAGTFYGGRLGAGRSTEGWIVYDTKSAGRDVISIEHVQNETPVVRWSSQ